MPYYFYDATYILVLIGALISMFASWNVQNTFRAYSRVWNSRNIPAQDIAQMILHDAGIYDVRIERIRGDLTDHYSPNEKVLRLSDSVYGSTSVAAIGVAAHECGHAIQHQEGYAPLKLRSFSVPLANIGSRLSWPIIVLGLFSQRKICMLYQKIIAICCSHHSICLHFLTLLKIMHYFILYHTAGNVSKVFRHFIVYFAILLDIFRQIFICFS